MMARIQDRVSENKRTRIQSWALGITQVQVVLLLSQSHFTLMLLRLVSAYIHSSNARPTH